MMRGDRHEYRRAGETWGTGPPRAPEISFPGRDPWGIRYVEKIGHPLNRFWAVF